MKKYSKYFVVAMSTLAFAFSTGTLIKVNATPAAAAAVPAQPVDLTYAAVGCTYPQHKELEGADRGGGERPVLRLLL